MNKPQSASSRKVHCPQCHAAIAWNPENPFRPFCSERCRLIDLGQWATGAYRIPQTQSDAGQEQEDEEG